MRICTLDPAGYRYSDFGHGRGAVIWWVDNHGRLNTFLSTGTEMHYELNRRMDMDIRWRGRIQPDGIVTMLPPICRQPDGNQDVAEMRIPVWLLGALKRLGGTVFLVDVAGKLKNIQEKPRHGRK